MAKKDTSIIRIAYKFRMYPTEEQKEFFEKQFGACRYIYNRQIKIRSLAYSRCRVSVYASDLQDSISTMKEYKEWLAEVNAIPLISAHRNADAAFKKFFDSGKGYPNFKSKRDSTQSFQLHQGYKIDVENGYIKLPKIGNIETRFHRKMEAGTTGTITVSRKSTGKYYVSILVDTGKHYPEPCEYEPHTTIGIDVGLSSFATLSTGEKINNPRFLIASEERLTILQRRLSRKVIGSANWKKVSKQVSKLHEHIANQRSNFLHNLSARLTSENQAIVVEDLNVKGLQRTKLSKSVSDVGWGEFIRQLEYKAKWKGKNLIPADRFFPSTKTCHVCMTKNINISLDIREWTCPTCNTHHDRDINAAINLQNYPFAVVQTGRAC